MGKETIIEKLLDNMSYLVKDNVGDYYFNFTKTDIISPNTFVETIHLSSFDFESRYVYHIDPGIREYICLCSDIDFIKLTDHFSKKDVANVITRLLEPIFHITSYFQTVKGKDIEDNLKYEWETFVKTKLIKDFNDKVRSFPFARIVYRSKDNTMVFYMKDYNQSTIFVLDSKAYNLDPEKDILDCLFEDSGKLKLSLNEDMSNFKIVNRDIVNAKPSEIADSHCKNCWYLS